MKLTHISLDQNEKFYCDFCHLEIKPGEDYLDTGEQFVCWRCANRMKRTAGEE